MTDSDNTIKVVDGFWITCDEYNWIVHEGKGPRGPVNAKYYRTPGECFQYILDQVVKRKRKWKTVKELADHFSRVAMKLAPIYQYVLLRPKRPPNKLRRKDG